MSTLLSPGKTDTPVQEADRRHRYLRWSVAALLIVSMLVTTGYTLISGYMATQLVQQARLPYHTTPANYHLSFRDVSFTSREDHLALSGWFIPGIRPDGSLTTRDTIIMVHGYSGNRATETVGMLAIASGFVHHGFAVLTFDLRAAGKSAAAPESMGHYEQRDVLGAVDFLQSDPLPYPELGRPQAIVGWGDSMGASTLLLAAAKEPAIQAVVADSAYGELLTFLKTGLPNHSHVSPLLTLGLLEAAQAIYGVNLAAVRPVDVVKDLAPRPVFFIQGDKDDTVPPSQMEELAQAARSAPGAHVQTWLVSWAGHAGSFHQMSEVYINRIVAFYMAVPGLKSGVASSQS